MPWWFWILLWAALLVCSAVALALGTFWLVRKGLRALADAGESLAGIGSGGRVARLASADDGAGSGQEASRTAPGSAVFGDPEEYRRAYRRGKDDRREARRVRRVARRAARGQAQSLSDLGLI